MDSMSPGWMSVRALVCSPSQPPASDMVLLIGIPSTTYNGSFPAVSEPIPLMLTLLRLPMLPDDACTFTPAILP